MLLPFSSEVLAKSATICRKTLITNILCYAIVKFNTVMTKWRKNSSIFTEERDSNQILSTMLTETKKTKNLGQHRVVLVKYIRLRPLLTKCNKVKVNLLSGNLKKVTTQVSASLLVKWQIRSRRIPYFWTGRKLKLYISAFENAQIQSQSFSYTSS